MGRVWLTGVSTAREWAENLECRCSGVRNGKENGSGDGMENGNGAGIRFCMAWREGGWGGEMACAENRNRIGEWLIESKELAIRPFGSFFAEEDKIDKAERMSRKK